MTFYIELTKLINKYSIENESNTPDFILAEFVKAALKAYKDTVNKRDEWYGGEKEKSKQTLSPTIPLEFP